jgi:hypothetical protein
VAFLDDIINEVLGSSGKDQSREAIHKDQEQPEGQQSLARPDEISKTASEAGQLRFLCGGHEHIILPQRLH